MVLGKGNCIEIIVVWSAAVKAAPAPRDQPTSGNKTCQSFNWFKLRVCTFCPRSSHRKSPNQDFPGKSTQHGKLSAQQLLGTNWPQLHRKTDRTSGDGNLLWSGMSRSLNCILILNRLITENWMLINYYKTTYTYLCHSKNHNADS